MSDELGRLNIGDYVAGRPERLFHVGRLDADTEGLLLVTNDGELAHRLMHPSFEVPKTYLATVRGEVPPEGADAVAAFRGTGSAIAAVIALGATLDYLASLDQAAVATHETALHAELLAGLGARAGIRLVGAPQLALASFTVDGVHSADLAHLLTEQGIAVRIGHHCAMPLLKSLGLPGAIRVSLGLYNDGEDLARLFVALDKALELLQ